MPYKTGYWGEQAKERSKRRKEYFRAYSHNKAPKIFRLGEFGEILARSKMNGSKRADKTSHDLKWNGQRIEVKTSQTPYREKFYKFDIRIQKRVGKTDFFFILILDEHTRELRHAYLIPNKAISSKVTLSISPLQSQYEKYRLCLQKRIEDERVGY